MKKYLNLILFLAPLWANAAKEAVCTENQIDERLQGKKLLKLSDKLTIKYTIMMNYILIGEFDAPAAEKTFKKAWTCRNYGYHFLVIDSGLDVPLPLRYESRAFAVSGPNIALSLEIDPDNL